MRSALTYERAADASKPRVTLSVGRPRPRLRAQACSYPQLRRIFRLTYDGL